MKPKYFAFLIITLPVAAVVKHCDECVYLHVCVCLSLHKDISGTTCAIFTKSVHAAYVRGSVLLWYVDDRPHRLSSGRG